MDRWLGATMTIRKVLGDCYLMKEDIGERRKDSGWYWFSGAIAGPADAEKYRIYKNSILIDIVPDGTCLYIYTTSRNHGRNVLLCLTSLSKTGLWARRRILLKTISADSSICIFKRKCVIHHHLVKWR